MAHNTPRYSPADQPLTLIERLCDPADGFFHKLQIRLR